MAITSEEAKKELAPLLANGKLCIFAGSGVSVEKPSKLPTWEGFVDKYIEICKSLSDTVKDQIDFTSIIDDATSYRGKDIVGTITALKNFIVKCKESGLVPALSENEINTMFASSNYNEYHKAIVGTNYKHILTTNYDLLLENAALKTGYKKLSAKTYTYKNLDRISEMIYTNSPAIVHIHGASPGVPLEEFIITKDDYKKIKDKNPGFRLLMNTLFTSNSMLMVGYGGSDPHLEDIIDDINLSLGWQTSQKQLELPTYYLILLKDKCSAIREYIKNQSRTKVISVDSFEESLDLLKYLCKKFPRPND